MKCNRCILFFLLIFFSHWVKASAIPAPTHFDTIACGMTIESTTFDAADQVPSDTCFTTSSIAYSGGDRSFYFELIRAQEISFRLVTPDSNGLDMFLFSYSEQGAVDSIHCIEARTSQGVDELLYSITLLPSKYMLVVDGRERYLSSEDTTIVEGGDFMLSMDCFHGDDFVLFCGDTIENDTALEFISSFESRHYEGCIPEVNALDYRAPDQLYRFDLARASHIQIHMIESDSVNLDLFLFSDSLNADSVHQPGQCIAVSVNVLPRSGELVDTLLPAGTYWIVVDGQIIASDPISFTQVGEYALWMECFDLYVSDLNCGVEMQDNNSDDFSSGSAIDYLTCLPTKSYDGSDRNYRLTRSGMTELKITLENISEDFALILREERYDSLQKALLPGQCLAISDSGQLQEEIRLVVDSGSYWITVDAEEGVTDSFSLSISCEDLVSPVELIGPFAEKLGNAVRITWRSLMEVDNEGFLLERSHNGLEWQSLNFTPGPGWSDTEKDYSFIDQNPLEGANYYRLIQIDFDGTKHHSDIIQFTVESGDIWKVVPSLVQNRVRILGPDRNARLQIHDSFGIRMGATQAINGSSDIDVSQWVPGVYHFRIFDHIGQHVISVLKM